MPDSTVTAFRINTVIIDSIAADTVSGRIPHFIPVEKADSMREALRADSIAATQTETAEPPSGIRDGLAPTVLTPSDSNSTPISALLMGTLVIMGLNGPAIRQALRSYSHELIGIRRRRNVFDNERTVSLPVAVLLALNLIVFGGIVLYNIPGVPPSPCIGAAALAMTVAAVYYFFRYTAYQIVGYTFALPEGKRQWVDGFLATEAYEGLLLIVPALLLVFKPQWHDTLITISLSIAAVARILFIAKGVRIFYVNLRSLLYFILYLCTIEIIPLLALYGICVRMQAVSA